MPNNKDLNNSLDLAGQLIDLVEANQEIAVMRIGRLRKKVTTSRDYSRGLAEVYSKVRALYQHYLAKKKKVNSKKQAIVLLSTKQRLAGSITAVTARHFIEYAAQHTTDDVIIVGRVGKERFKQIFPTRRIIFHDIEEQEPDLDKIAPFLKQLLSYQKVTLFYPQFDNVVHQEPIKINLGEDLAEQEAEKSRKTTELRSTGYMIEPSVDEVIDFFDNQIFALVIQQLFTEADLALVGSRITAMETAADAVGKDFENLKITERRNTKREKNRKQRERLAGMLLWQQ